MILLWAGASCVRGRGQAPRRPAAGGNRRRVLCLLMVEFGKEGNIVDRSSQPVRAQCAEQAGTGAAACRQLRPPERGERGTGAGVGQAWRRRRWKITVGDAAARTCEGRP